MQTQVSDTGRRKSLLLVVFAGALLLGGFFLVRNMASAQNSSLLQLSDLPEGFAVVEDRYVASPDKDDGGGHPLTADALHDFADEDQQRLSAYEKWQSFGALHPDVGLVFNFVYDYASESEAIWAAQTLQAYWERYGSTPMDIALETELAANSLRGRQYFVTSADGDEVCHWFFGHRGKTLVIFWVHGVDANRANHVAESYRAALVKLGNK